MQNRKWIFEKILRKRIKFSKIIISEFIVSDFWLNKFISGSFIFIKQNILRIKRVKKYIFKIFIFNSKIHFPLRRKFFTKKKILSKHQNKFKECFLKISFLIINYYSIFTILSELLNLPIFFPNFYSFFWEILIYIVNRIFQLLGIF